MELRRGATVLEFARGVRQEFVAYVRGARVKGRGFLDPLATIGHDEVVYLQLDSHPRPLPGGYREAIGDRQAIRAVERAFLVAYRPELEKLGRLALTRRLLDAGLVLGLRTIGPDETLAEAGQREATLLDELVRTALEGLKRSESVSSVYVELAREEGRDQHRIPHARIMDTALLDKLMLRIHQEAVAMEFRFRHPEWKNVRAERCGRCYQRVEPAWVEVVHARDGESSLLVYHVERSRCYGVRRRSERRTLEAPPPPRIFVRTHERRGIAAELAVALATTGIGLNEFSARATGTEAVVRMEVDIASEATMRGVKATLRHVYGVKEVYGPQDDVPDDLLVRMNEPRRGSADPEISPYDVGVLLREQERLYGREEAVEELTRWVETALRGDIAAQQAVWVRGPFKHGKSSLVEVLIENRRLSLPTPTLAVRNDAAGVRSWRWYSHDLAQAILGAVAALLGCSPATAAIRLEVPAPEPPSEATPTRARPYAVHVLVEAARRIVGVPVIVAIDEIVHLLLRTEPDRNALGNMLTCLRALMRTPGVALLLVGTDTSWELATEAAKKLLRESKWISLAQLERNIATALVQREKSSQRQHLSSRTLDRMYHIALGHPLWTQALADEMWRESRKGGKRRALNDLLLNAAVERVVRQPAYFSQHMVYLQQEGAAHEIFRALLREMIRQRADVLRKPGEHPPNAATAVFDEETLQQRIGASRAASRELTILLQQMEAMGSIVFNGNRSWRVPPLLLGHLLEYDHQLDAEPLAPHGEN